MTAIINNTVVSGKAEEIKALLDLYNPPTVVTTVEFNKPELDPANLDYIGSLGKKP